MGYCLAAVFIIVAYAFGFALGSLNSAKDHKTDK